MRDVVITGMGVVLPGCDSKEELWRQLSEQDCQLSLEPATGGDRGRVVGRIHGFDADRYLPDVPSRYYSQCPRDVQLYLASVALARRDARLDECDATRTGLYDGTSRASFSSWYERIRRERDHPARDLYTRNELARDTPGQAVGIAAALMGVQGPALTFTASCSSATVALGQAFRDVAMGTVDIAYAGGHEAALVPPLHLMYQEAGLCSPEQETPARAVRPWADSTGNVFGEAAVTLVLEERERAEGRGATLLAGVAGYAYGNTGLHPTHVDVTGARPTRVVRQLLDDTATPRERVGFLIGHGNGVPASDLAEMRMMHAVFGPHASAVPLLSTKPVYGHGLGAAGAVNAAAATLMLRERRLFRTLNADPSATVEGLSFGSTESLPVDRLSGVCLSFGLGGHNAALLFRGPGRCGDEKGLERENDG
ncbi:beta-ketoacyl synthase N-terminal-like domain-containing protein [Streptomyces lavendulae]|uniref:beta-ketoacyl synthase N-terminal-like domain-containing protein n=1 Tax=Streptomyces lavendulae TaxID=1914 RepID=UPI0024A55FA0|nr:beta-ketoacyl synthase N-terminal-like domain-containing protein [Streptomyces lavendulae]GLW04065.1 3-oxoacyl-ACP synthase [Streptomyces lavendulae subsp. lavendulae]